MSKEEFKANVQRAIGLLNVQVATDSNKVDAAQLSQNLNSCDIWLTQKSVEDFDSVDFSELPEADRRKLETEVAAFLEIAEGIVVNGPATAQQAIEAKQHLLAIATILGLLPMED